MTSGDRDLYAVLGVDVGASTTTIAHAYRTLVRRHHPDTRDPRVSGEEHAAHDDELRRIGAAYRVLSDPHRRAEYDRHRPRGALETGPGETARRVAEGPAVHVLPAVVLGRVSERPEPSTLWIKPVTWS